MNVELHVRNLSKNILHSSSSLKISMKLYSQSCFPELLKRDKKTNKIFPFHFFHKIISFPWKDIFEVKIPFSFVKKCSYISFTIISNFKGDELIKNRIPRSLINIDLKRNIASLKIYRSLNFTLISVTDEFSSWLVRIDHLSSMYVCKVYLHLCISMHW